MAWRCVPIVQDIFLIASWFAMPLLYKILWKVCDSFPIDWYAIGLQWTYDETDEFETSETDDDAIDLLFPTDSWLLYS